jgi:hypothetical protein
MNDSNSAENRFSKILLSALEGTQPTETHEAVKCQKTLVVTVITMLQAF